METWLVFLLIPFIILFVVIMPKIVLINMAIISALVDRLSYRYMKWANKTINRIKGWEEFKV